QRRGLLAGAEILQQFAGAAEIGSAARRVVDLRQARHETRIGLRAYREAAGGIGDEAVAVSNDQTTEANEGRIGTILNGGRSGGAERCDARSSAENSAWRIAKVSARDAGLQTADRVGVRHNGRDVLPVKLGEAERGDDKFRLKCEDITISSRRNRIAEDRVPDRGIAAVQAIEDVSEGGGRIDLPVCA